MTEAIRVDPTAAAEAEDEYARLVLEPEQRRIVEDVSAVMARHTGMSELPTRGFFWQALRRWQQRHRATVASWIDMTADERSAAGREIVDTIEEILGPHLHDDADRRRLREGTAAALRHYQQVYAARQTGHSP